MRILHAFIFFSIRFAGGTCDLIYKLAKVQACAGLKPIISTGDYKFDAELSESLTGVEFWVERSWLNRAGFSIMRSIRIALPFFSLTPITP